MPRSSRPLKTIPIALRQLEVLRIEDITPGMRRITLTGEELGAAALPNGSQRHAFMSTGFDDDIRLIFPYPGQSEPVLPIVIDGDSHWPKDPRPISRTYTVRRYDPGTRELDIDFVKHGVGIATTWAYRTTPGDRIHVIGPPACHGLPDAGRLLLVAGDETALPAIARLLEQLPEDARGMVFIEIAERAHEQRLRELPGVTVSWLSRDGAAPGSGSLLLDAVRASSWEAGQDIFAWLAGEQSAVRDLRRFLVEERGVPKQDIDFTGYWKQSQVVPRAEDPQLPERADDADEAFEELHELAEILPPLAIRAAVSLGIPEEMARGSTSLPALAGATGCDERALAKLLRYLHAIGIVRPGEEGEYLLSETGELLTEEFIASMLRSDGLMARRERALQGLEESVRTGRASYASVTGTEFPALREQPEVMGELLSEAIEMGVFVAAPLAEAAAVRGIRHLVVYSDAAASLAEGLTRTHEALRITIPASPGEAAWLRADLPESVPQPAQRERISIAEQFPYAPLRPIEGADAALIAMRLVQMPDEQAVAYLRSAADALPAGSRILVLETLFREQELDEHDAEADLMNLTMHGSGLRTAAELDELIRRAGLRIVASEPIGWGDVLRVLERAE